jgi:hypothetical protein
VSVPPKQGKEKGYSGSILRILTIQYAFTAARRGSGMMPIAFNVFFMFRKLFQKVFVSLPPKLGMI